MGTFCHSPGLLDGETIMADITVRVAAKDFIKSTGATGVTSAVKGNPLITQGSGHTIEWKVTLPKAGKWRLHALMSSHIPNSCNLFINGAQQNGTILGEATNGASSDTQHYFSYGPFDFKAGENVFAIKCLKAQPSLWEFGFSLEQEATAPAPEPAPAPAPTAPAPAPTTDNTFIRIPSKDFTNAKQGAVREDGELRVGQGRVGERQKRAARCRRSAQFRRQRRRANRTRVRA
jgi:hypothetical protein